MFSDTFQKYKVDENEVSIGDLEVNHGIFESSKFLKPFIRDHSHKYIIKMGERNYEAINKYIIASMNDYYNRLANASNTERKRMLDTYKRLYEMWEELHRYKNANNLSEMDKIYDLFSYELYVLGYTE